MGRLATSIIILGLLIGIPVSLYRNEKYKSVRMVNITVTNLPNRDLQYNANGDKNAYANLVYTDKGTFENTDSWFPYKRDSSDLYGMLAEDGNYTCSIAGWRIGLLNKYPNLIHCEAQQ